MYLIIFTVFAHLHFPLLNLILFANLWKFIFSFLINLYFHSCKNNTKYFIWKVILHWQSATVNKGVDKHEFLHLHCAQELEGVWSRRDKTAPCPGGGMRGLGCPALASDTTTLRTKQWWRRILRNCGPFYLFETWFLNLKNGSWWEFSK